jgi:hypothetical protein
MRLKLLVWQTMEIRKKALGFASSPIEVFAREIDLSTVTGRKHGCFGAARSSGQSGQSLVETPSGEIQALAELDGGRSMADADQQQVHLRARPQKL